MTTFQSPINLSVPVFNIYNDSFSSIIANDQIAHLSLQKMAEAAKKEQKVFKSLAEPLIDGLIDIAPSWPTTNDIMTLDADSSRTPGLTFGLQGPVNVHRGALLLVPQ